MFRISAFHVGSYGLDSCLQYYERFWSNFAFNWCGGDDDDVDRYLRHFVPSRRVARRLCEPPFSRVPYIFTGCGRYTVL
jgi:hypothetical protein